MLPAPLTTKERKGARSSWSQLLFQASRPKVFECRKIGSHHVLRVACIRLSLGGPALAGKEAKNVPPAQSGPHPQLPPLGRARVLRDLIPAVEHPRWGKGALSRLPFYTSIDNPEKELLLNNQV